MLQDVLVRASWKVSGGGYKEQELQWLPHNRVRLGGEVLNVLWTEAGFALLRGSCVLGNFEWTAQYSHFKGRCHVGGYWHAVSLNPSLVVKYFKGTLKELPPLPYQVTVPRVTPHTVLMTLDPYDGPFSRKRLQFCSPSTVFTAPWELPLEIASIVPASQLANGNQPALWLFQFFKTLDKLFKLSAQHVTVVRHTSSVLDFPDPPYCDFVILGKSLRCWEWFHISSSFWNPLKEHVFGVLARLPRSPLTGYKYPEAFDVVGQSGEISIDFPTIGIVGLLKAASIRYNARN
jgi:hypothetical protein